MIMGKVASFCSGNPGMQVVVLQRKGGGSGHIFLNAGRQRGSCSTQPLRCNVLPCRYIHTNGRGLDFHEETKLNLDAEEEKALAERRRSSEAASSSGGSSRGHHFICEAFFLTAKTLHLGTVKAMQVSDQEAEVRAYTQLETGRCAGRWVVVTLQLSGYSEIEIYAAGVRPCLLAWSTRWTWAPSRPCRCGPGAELGNWS